MGGSKREGAGRPDPTLSLTPVKNHKNIVFLSNTGPDPLTNHKAIKPAFNVGSLSDRQWIFNGVSLPGRKSEKKNEKKTLSELESLWQNFLDPRMFAFYQSHCAKYEHTLWKRKEEFTLRAVRHILSLFDLDLLVYELQRVLLPQSIFLGNLCFLKRII